MKYRVLRDQGVDVAGKHYAHDAVIDDKKVEGNQAATELAALVKNGLIVEDAGKGKE